MNLSKRHNIISIKDKSEIRFILNYGKKINTKFGPVFLFNVANDNNKKAAVLLKKNIGKAHYRNYIKRLLRVYIIKKIILFKTYNRVIFLYRSKSRISNHLDIFSEYDKRLNKICNSN